MLSLRKPWSSLQSSGPLSPSHSHSHIIFPFRAASTAGLPSFDTLPHFQHPDLPLCLVFSGATTPSTFFYKSIHDVLSKRTTAKAVVHLPSSEVHSKTFGEAVDISNGLQRRVCTSAKRNCEKLKFNFLQFWCAHMQLERDTVTTVLRLSATKMLLAALVKQRLLQTGASAMCASEVDKTAKE